MNSKMRSAWCFWLLVAVTAITLSATGEPQRLDDRITRLLLLEEHCKRVSDLPYTVGESCARSLNDYFEAEPIWSVANLVVNWGGKGRVHASVFNSRSLMVSYTASDLSSDEVPRWRDVFDGRIHDRLKIVLTVLDDEACKRFEVNGEIKPGAASQCRARELFKYAAYLDACMTGVDRSSFLHTEFGPDGQTLYGRVREYMDPSLRVDEDEGNGWQFLEKYLHTIWVNEKCASMSFALVGNAADQFEHTSSEDSMRALRKALKPMHDSAMAISARAGDPWAIQSFYASGLYHDFAYWKSLRRLNPSLFHRWMARIGYTMLDKKDLSLLALKAYSVEKRVSPSLDMDLYLGHFGITRDDFDVPARQVESLLQNMQWEEELKYPWDIRE